jgi:hypothetical protein
MIPRNLYDSDHEMFRDSVRNLSKLRRCRIMISGKKMGWLAMRYG